MHTAFRPALPPTRWNIICDFDGTIALDDVIDVLLEKYALPGWELLEQRWRQGQIGSFECMRGQVELLDVDEQQLQEDLDNVAIDAAFQGFVTRARELAMPVRVVSDGLDYVIRRILWRHGLADLPIIANELLRAATPRRWRLNAPFAAAGCRSATCKCLQIASADQEPSPWSLLIGDGASDYCVAGQADFVFAKDRLIDHCRLNGIPHWPIAGFADATRLLPQLANLNADAAATTSACSTPDLTG